MCWYPLFRVGTRIVVALSKICSVVPKPEQTFMGILLCFIVTARVCVPGRDCSLGLQDSDRPYGLPGWLWQTGLDPPTPDVLPDCWDLTHQPGRLPVSTKYCHQQKQASKKHLCCLSILPVLQLQWGHIRLWKQMPHSLRTQPHLRSYSSWRSLPWILPGPGWRGVDAQDEKRLISESGFGCISEGLP